MDDCFNRTFMELKGAYNGVNAGWYRRFNRTFMELKDISSYLNASSDLF